MSDYKQRLNFLEINEKNIETGQEFFEVLSKKFPEVLDHFYAHINGQKETAEIIGDQSRIPSLKSAQSSHWGKLFSGSFDQDYFDSISRIGHVHEKIGLEPKWYLGGYSLVINEIIKLAIEKYKNKPQKLQLVIETVIKYFFLDIDVGVSTYFDSIRHKSSNMVKEFSKSFQEDVKSIVDGVARSAQNMQSSAEEVKDVVNSTNQIATEASSASEQASVNVQTVAAAADQLATSVQEISEQVTISSDITKSAVNEAKVTNSAMQGLEEAAQKIGDVVSLINQIAGQTNLLALNATIEAARAGDSGKGFAVVASEVKSLANQTAKATEDISLQIGEIQAATNQAVQAIQKVGDTITKMDEVSTRIASAVEEQGLTTNEIARNVNEASHGTTEVSKSMVSVADAAAKSGKSAEHVFEECTKLTQQSKVMSDQIEQFVEKIEVATR